MSLIRVVNSSVGTAVNTVYH